jgi:hypothetical protein
MISMHVVIVTMAALAAGSAVVSAQPAPEAKPNVVLIITDDLGSADLSSYGARDIRTPHIDSLARDGVRLTQFYANAPWCTPTRVGRICGTTTRPSNRTATRPT